MPRRIASRRVASHRVAPRRAAPGRGHATPCRCRADLLSSRVHVPAHPHGSVRSSGSVLIGGWQSGQADRFSLTASLSVFLLRASPSSRFPPPLHPSPPRPPHSFGLSSSLLKHTFRIFPLPCVSASPPSLSLSLSLLFLYVALVLTMETHSPSSRRSSPFTLTTTLVVDSHPRDATHRAERKYLCRCIVSRFLSSRGILTCDQYSRCQRNCQSYMPSI